MAYRSAQRQHFASCKCGIERCREIAPQSENAESGQELSKPLNHKHNVLGEIWDRQPRHERSAFS